MTRPVMVFKYDQNRTKIEDGFAVFHQFGSDFEDYGEYGPANFSTAIIEREDGTIETTAPDLIKFTDR